MPRRKQAAEVARRVGSARTCAAAAVGLRALALVGPARWPRALGYKGVKDRDQWWDKTTDQTSHSPRYPNASTNTRYE